jgi:hypothetical protein
MDTTAKPSGLETQKGCTVLPVQPLAIFVNNGTDENTASALRLQRLSLLGIIGQRANLLASLVWEKAA